MIKAIVVERWGDLDEFLVILNTVAAVEIYNKYTKIYSGRIFISSHFVSYFL